MAIRRTKIDRTPKLKKVRGRIVDLPAPGWKFTVDCPDHGPTNLDFESLKANGRVELAAHVRDAGWSMRHEIVGVTLQSYLKQWRRFFRFLDHQAEVDQNVTLLAQIDRPLLVKYLTWMAMTPTEDTGAPLALAAQSFSYTAIKSFLRNRQRWVPDQCHPQLAFPKNAFPNLNRRSPPREPYSGDEHMRIVRALNSDLRAIHAGKSTLDDGDVLVVYLLALAIATGRNAQPLIELRRDSIGGHPAPGRKTLTTFKRRGRKTQVTSIKTGNLETNVTAVPANVAEYCEALAARTEALAADADADTAQFLFLMRKANNPDAGKVRRVKLHDLARTGFATFVQRHGLLDDAGRPLTLNISRLRPTYATELYRRTGDIRVVQREMGHSHLSLTVQRYARLPLEADRDHAYVVNGMVAQYTKVKTEGGKVVLIAADGSVPLQGVQDLLSGGYNTGIARCKNPFREEDSVCKKFLYCFRCPNMMVFEDDLWRLFSFYYRLVTEQPKISPGHWIKTYAPVVRRIDVDIAPQFPEEAVAAAKAKARAYPHPTWKSPLA